MDVRVISIGCLSANPLWGEKAAVRTGHATTTLVRVGPTVIVVDPGLPAPALAARLNERAGLSPEQVTHVFLTRFHPDTVRGLDLFPDAAWLISHEEREGIGVPLAETLRRTARADAESGEPDVQTRAALERQINLLQRCSAAPQRLADGVDLFPLPGVSPGLTGLLLAEEDRTTLVCGDSVATAEHLARAMVLPNCASVEAARTSFAEAVEVADLLVLGRDNIVFNDRSVI
ncbi:MAG: MBL fold metallo-hydrolase [Phycisphaerae bacterium]|nr:MBL fold metallo-hydrolase [Phycisphaerae bacterium]